uniref:NADH-ubiquinone oxidoreductase chain 3 n=1 Tax=Gondwanalimnadia sp. MT-2020 TaxID=2731355 RepID=A0A6M4ST25_9CRUS|nr:NADH dehydrogenase subunit 3 [Gondwanalimnadia sp. MT-2020]
MYFIMILAFTLCLIVTVVLLLAMMFSKKTFLDREKSSPFECGFDPAVSSRLPFSLRFFLIALIFLIFDVEVVLLFPSVVSSNFVSLSGWFQVMVFFILVLLGGLYFEWKYGALEWAL